MSILYAVISQGPVVLARYASCAGNFQEVADQILAQVNVDTSPPRMTYTHGNYLTHYVISNGVINLCITDNTFDRYRAFLFLEDIKGEFQKAAQSSPRDPSPYVWNESIAEVLSSKMEYHNKNPNTDKVMELRSQVEDVQQTLVRNIEELASRGERLELLVDKTQNLDTSSVLFRVQAQQVHRQLWWRNARYWVCIAVAVALSIYLLGAAFCGFSWKNCKS